MAEAIQTYLWLALAAVAAGAINAVAGGGTLLTFPALSTIMLMKLANATSTVALVPGSFASAWGYGPELRQAKWWAFWLAWPSLAGGIVGSILLVRLPETFFKAVVPWLILIAAVLFLLQPRLAKLRRQTAGSGRLSLVGWAAAVVFQFVVAVYGGYFGAGIGILMLSSLGLMGIGDIHQMNAVKTFLAVCINGVSVAVFVFERQVVWDVALVMAVAAIIGGYAGARVARRLNRNLVRWVVIVIAFSLAGYFFHKQSGERPVPLNPTSDLVGRQASSDGWCCSRIRKNSGRSRILANSATGRTKVDGPLAGRSPLDEDRLRPTIDRNIH
jgi:uncharacterized membrane protein YfcA